MGSAKNVNVNGKVGHLVFYEYRGKSCVRTAPGSIRQTSGMQKSASLFGLASRISAYLRAQMENFLPNSKDKPMLYAFNSAIHQWLRTQQPGANTFSASNFYIDQFQFNQDAPLPVLVKQPVVARFSATGDIEVDIPELMPGIDMIAPAGTVNVHWNARVYSTQIHFNRNDCTQVSGWSEDIRQAEAILPYKDEPMPPQRLPLQLKQSTDALTIVVVRLQYEAMINGTLQLVTDKRWKPAGIVGSCFGAK